MNHAIHALAWPVAVASALAVGGCGGGSEAGREQPATASAKAANVEVLSSRADAVSGGDALVRLTLPPGAAAQGFRVTAAGRDVGSAFRSVAPGEYVGLVDGLPEGISTIMLQAAKGRGLSASIQVRNHPLKGPIFSGQQQTFHVCGTVAAGLGAPLDADCSAGTRVDYLYKSTDGALKPYDPAGTRPADMGTTVDIAGRRIDFIVRRERGTINRAIYEFLFRHLPGTALPDPWGGASGWNGKLVFAFGGNCRAAYRQDAIPGAVFDTAGTLDSGYAVISSSMNVFGNDCNDVRSAEAASMVKEAFIEKFGAPAFTIGHGASGGSMQQHLIAQNYPGVLDGILPSASYPDLYTIIPWVSDCKLLAEGMAKSGLEWTDEQKTAASGFATWNTCNAWIASFSTTWIDPKACRPGIPPEAIYDAATNPGGVRCTIADNMVQQVGIDPATGFARRALDNVGVQYGLAAFEDGAISAEQFVALNEHVGGFDIDGNVTAARTIADAKALHDAYAKGRVNSGGGSLASIPVIDYRPYLDTFGDIHDRVRSFSTRERLARVNGAANHVILVGPVTGGDVIGSIVALDHKVLAMMDAWLTDLARDRSAAPIAEKLARARPADAVDGCWTATGERIAEPAGATASGRCNALYPVHRDPRRVAGAPLANDVLKCQLRPLDRARYSRPLTDPQWARLQAALPEGVCDYALPGVGQGGIAVTWLRY